MATFNNVSPSKFQKHDAGQENLSSIHYQTSEAETTIVQ